MQIYLNFSLKKKKKFSERISLFLIINKEMILYNNNKSIVTIKQALENKYKEIKNYIDSLRLYHNYLSHFIINQYHTEYTKIIKIIFLF
jgi:hypothetical protein